MQANNNYENWQALVAAAPFEIPDQFMELIRQTQSGDRNDARKLYIRLVRYWGRLFNDHDNAPDRLLMVARMDGLQFHRLRLVQMLVWSIALQSREAQNPGTISAA
jgi:dihydrodipicolinate synthase/N-acetylneuraminate lyase